MASKDETMGEQPEGQPFQAESAEAAEAAMDKALEDLVGEDDESEHERPEELASEPVEKEEEEDEPEDAEARPPKEEQPAEEPPETDQGELTKAYQAYMRDGFTKAQAEALQKTLGDEDFVTTGLHRLKVQKDTDALYSSHSRDGVEEEPSAQPQAEPAEPDLPASNLRELASPFLEAIETGDEGKAAEALSNLLRTTQQPLMERVSRAEELAVYAGQALESEWREGAMRELLGDSPGELMGDSREAVESAYAALAKSEMRKDLKGRARITALTKLALQDAAPQALEAAIRQSKGSASPKPKPTPTRVRSKGKKARDSNLTPDQRFERAAWGVLDGENLDDVAEQYRQR
jgi:hypothetical protein